MYPPSSSPTQSLSSFILIIASLTVGGLVRLWLSAYLSAPASEEEEEEADVRVCGYAAAGRVWRLLRICCGYISLIQLIASVYCCSRAAAVQQEWTEHFVPSAFAGRCVQAVHQFNTCHLPGAVHLYGVLSVCVQTSGCDHYSPVLGLTLNKDRYQ